MERAVEERKPRREGSRHDGIVKSRQNRFARALALEEEDDLAGREKDLPAIHALGGDRLHVVGKELLRTFARAGFRRATRTTRSLFTSASLGG